jgi:hypothetical protein
MVTMGWAKRDVPPKACVVGRIHPTMYSLSPRLPSACSNLQLNPNPNPRSSPSSASMALDMALQAENRTWPASSRITPTPAKRHHQCLSLPNLMMGAAIVYVPVQPQVKMASTWLLFCRANKISSPSSPSSTGQPLAP